MSDSSKAFDPTAGFGDMQSMFANYANAWRSVWSPVFPPARYETLDPTVQEIAVLATMHNMASMLQSSGELKAMISSEIAERAKKLG
jgi:hypothetical protein